jgi:Toprim domain
MPSDGSWIVVTEGIETAAAVAYAFQEEVARGELIVASAISAAGVEAFAPWPNTATVICAADRDENKAGTGHRRGERSARNLALSLALEERSPVRTMIALPGKPGSNTDFLDLSRAEGPEAVRAAILAAAPFQPTPEELEEFKNRGARKSELEEIANRYPLPSLIGLRVEYRHTDDNRVWLHKYAGFDKETGEHLWDPISSPFGALVLLETAGPQPAYGLRLHLRTQVGATNTIDFSRGELPLLGASGVRSMLMLAGVRVANGGKVAIVEILKQAEPSDCITVAPQFGWYAQAPFLTPGGKPC